MRKPALFVLMLLISAPAIAQGQPNKDILEGVIQSWKDRTERLKKPLFERASEWRCDLGKRTICALGGEQPECKTSSLTGRSISVAKKSGQNNISIKECGGILKDATKDKTCDETIGLEFPGAEETDIYYVSFARPFARIENDGGNITIVMVSSQTTMIEHGRCAPQ